MERMAGYSKQENPLILVAKHLRDLGHQKFVVGGRINSEAIIQRFNGYKRALSKYNIPLKESDVYSGNFSVDSGYKNIKKILSENITLQLSLLLMI